MQTLLKLSHEKLAVLACEKLTPKNWLISIVFFKSNLSQITLWKLAAECVLDLSVFMHAPLKLKFAYLYFHNNLLIFWFLSLSIAISYNIENNGRRRKICIIGMTCCQALSQAVNLTFSTPAPEKDGWYINISSGLINWSAYSQLFSVLVIFCHIQHPEVDTVCS